MSDRHNYNLAYYQKNKDKLKADTRAYYLKHKKAMQLAKLRYDYEEFGWTPEWHETQLKKYKHRCAVCRKKKRLCVDHKRRVRGLLCDNCNRMLGHAKDNATTLRRAAVYVIRNR